MPEARKTPTSQRFAGLRLEMVAGFAGCRGELGGNSRLAPTAVPGDPQNHLPVARQPFRVDDGYQVMCDESAVIPIVARPPA